MAYCVDVIIVKKLRAYVFLILCYNICYLILKGTYDESCSYIQKIYKEVNVVQFEI